MDGWNSEGRCRGSFERLLDIVIHKGLQLCEEDVLHGFLDLVETLLRLKPITLQLPLSLGQPYLVILASAEVVQEI